MSELSVVVRGTGIASVALKPGESLLFGRAPGGARRVIMTKSTSALLDDGENQAEMRLLTVADLAEVERAARNGPVV